MRSKNFEKFYNLFIIRGYYHRNNYCNVMIFIMCKTNISGEDFNNLRYTAKLLEVLAENNGPSSMNKW